MTWETRWDVHHRHGSDPFRIEGRLREPRGCRRFRQHQHRRNSKFLNEAVESITVDGMSDTPCDYILGLAFKYSCRRRTEPGPVTPTAQLQQTPRGSCVPISRKKSIYPQDRVLHLAGISCLPPLKGLRARVGVLDYPLVSHNR